MLLVKPEERSSAAKSYILFNDYHLRLCKSPTLAYGLATSPCLKKVIRLRLPQEGILHGSQADFLFVIVYS
jgi:hypothetical protein